MNDEDAVKPVSTVDAEDKSPGIGLSWRLAAGAGALLIIAVLLLPVLWPAQNSSTPTAADAPAEATATVVSTAAASTPDTAKGQFELGNSLYESGQLDQAVQAYLAAIKMDPNYQAAYANLGVVYYQQQKFDLAASQYEKALELNPDDGDVAYNLGVLYLQQALSKNQQPDPQLLNKAVSQLQQAQKLSPTLAEPYFSLGVAYLSLNESDKAIEAFEKFLSFDSKVDPRARQEAERYLKQLKEPQP